MYKSLSVCLFQYILPNGSKLCRTLRGGIRNNIVPLGINTSETKIDKYLQHDVSKGLPDIINSSTTQNIKIAGSYVSNSCDSPKKTVENNFEPTIIKLKESDTLLSKMLLKVKSKKTRAKSGLIMLEGKRLIKDAYAAGVIPIMIFFSRKQDLMELGITSKAIKVYKTSYKELQNWSDLTTSPGIIAVCKIPQATSHHEGNLPVTVICDQVREPGNLGSILRNAAGAGVEKLILTTGCTDIWDTKVLRAASGAHFRVPIYNNINWQNISEHIPNTSKILLADNKPSIGDCSRRNILPLVKYYSLKYWEEPNITIVIGGETEGLSDEAFQVAARYNSSRVIIPLSNEVDSLNSSHALSVILFEIKRQMEGNEYIALNS